MKIQNETSISQLPKEISKGIQEISARSKRLDSKNIMQAYKFYAHLASQVMNHEDYVAPEPEEGEGLRVEGLEGDES